MTAIIIRNPLGKVPKLKAETLQSNQAQSAENCKLDRNSVRPLAEPLQIKDLSAGTVSIFKNNDTWLEFNVDTDVIQSPVDAENNRYYFTNPGERKKADDLISAISLGVAQPGTGPSLTIAGTGDGNVERSSVYIYTRVTDWDEESAPSQPSGNIDVENGEHVTFSGLSDDSNSHVTHYRIYRAVAGTEGAEYELVPYQTTAGTLKYDDNNEIIYDIPKGNIGNAVDGADDSQLSITLDTRHWYEPPSGLTCLTDIGNGIVAGISGKQVCFAEPWVPYAWPTAYQYAMDTDAVAVGTIAGIPIGLTGQSVYLFDGSTPDSYMQRKISDNQGCKAKRSVVSTMAGVFFASSDGLCLATTNGVRVLTERIYTKQQWNDEDIDNLVGAFYDGAYYGFFSGSSAGFILELDSDGGKGVTAFDMGDYTFLDCHVEPSNDKLYVALSDGVNKDIFEFDAAESDLTATWKSKKFITYPLNFSSFIILGDSGTSTLTYYADGVSKLSTTVTHNQMVRLPSGFMARTHEIQIAGTTSWWSFGVATSATELAENGL